VSDAHEVEAERGRSYYRLHRRFRVAILEVRHAELTPARRVVALLMLEGCTRKAYRDSGDFLETWLGAATIAACLGMTGRGVQKARLALCKIRLLQVTQRGGSEPGDTSTYRFREDWLERAERDLEVIGALGLLKGKKNEAGAALVANAFREKLRTVVPKGANGRSERGEPPFRKGVNGRAPDSVHLTQLKD